MDNPNVLNSQSLSYFMEGIPDCWLEILEMDTPAMFSVMKSYGALACLLFFRISKLCKENTEPSDLRLLR